MSYVFYLCVATIYFLKYLILFWVGCLRVEQKFDTEKNKSWSVFEILFILLNKSVGRL